MKFAYKTNKRQKYIQCSRHKSQLVISRGEILAIGLLRILSPTRTSTTRTRSSWPGYVHSIFPTALGSITITMSPTLRFNTGKNHFCQEPANMREVLLHPSAPHVPDQLLHSPPTSPRIKQCCINALRNKIPTHLANRKMIRCQHWLVIGVLAYGGERPGIH